MGGLKRMAAWFVARKEKFWILGVGLVGNTLITYAFDYALYPYVVWEMGIVKGGVVMTVASFAVCYLTILFYDWTKKDWLGIETIKRLKEFGGSSKFAKFTSWIMRKGDPVAMVFLSIKFDPFITMVYMRHGDNQYNGMNKRDWKIFMSSLFIANAYWTLVSFAGASVAVYVWNLF